MFMITKDYSRVRGHLTRSIRHLQCILKSTQLIDEEVYSEISYWEDTLTMIRTCLYECTDAYYGQIDIQDAIHELQSEMLASYKIVYARLSKEQQRDLAEAWLACKKAGDMLND